MTAEEKAIYDDYVAKCKAAGLEPSPPENILGEPTSCGLSDRLMTIETEGETVEHKNTENKYHTIAGGDESSHAFNDDGDFVQTGGPGGKSVSAAAISAFDSKPPTAKFTVTKKWIQDVCQRFYDLGVRDASSPTLSIEDVSLNVRVRRHE